jgi:4-hydroxy-2-oxoheptanedioate aldolase
MITPALQQKLEASTPAFGVSMSFDDPAILERMGPGWDFVWIDMQHGSTGMDRIKHIVRTCELLDSTSLVRVPGHDLQTIAVVMDLDVGGVIVPQVDTPEQARELLRPSRFPPLGNRSYAGLRVIDRQGPKFNEYANQRQLIVVQLESPEAVANADAIAAIDGIDVLMLAPSDLSMRMGLPPDGGLDRTELLKAGETVAAAAKAHGKACLAIAFDKDAIRSYAGRGFGLIMIGGDAGFVRQGNAAARQMIADL